MKIKKCLGMISACIILMSSVAFNAQAIEKDIEVNNNIFTITVSDCGQLNYIMWSKDRYQCEIEGGKYI